MQVDYKTYKATRHLDSMTPVPARDALRVGTIIDRVRTLSGHVLIWS